MCKMKNITLRIDEEMLDDAREIAASRATSVNALVRDYLQGLVSDQRRREEARREILDLCTQSTAELGERKWSREDIYDR